MVFTDWFPDFFTYLSVFAHDSKELCASAKAFEMTKSEKTKNFIIEKTIPIFIRKGYEGTSLSDIEEATNLSKGSIYGNFANKEEVILAVFDHILLEVNATIDREVVGNNSSAEKILVFGMLFNKCSDLIQPAIRNMIARLAGKSLCQSVFMKSIREYINSLLFSQNWPDFQTRLIKLFLCQLIIKAGENSWIQQ